MSQRAADTRTKFEIAKILQTGRDNHDGHPAVLALIRVLNELNPIYKPDLIIHISKYFNNVYELFRNARDLLAKILGSVGFSSAYLG